MRYIIFMTIFFLVGCETLNEMGSDLSRANEKSKLTDEQAKSILPDKCKDLFFDPSSNSYQSTSSMFWFKTVFALSVNDDGAYSCAWEDEGKITDGYFVSTPSWQQVEALALTKCDEKKGIYSGNPKAPCRVFARNKNIIWNANIESTFK